MLAMALPVESQSLTPEQLAERIRERIRDASARDLPSADRKTPSEGPVADLVRRVEERTRRWAAALDRIPRLLDESRRVVGERLRDRIPSLDPKTAETLAQEVLLSTRHVLNGSIPEEIHKVGEGRLALHRDAEGIVAVWRDNRDRDGERLELQPIIQRSVAALGKRWAPLATVAGEVVAEAMYEGRWQLPSLRYETTREGETVFRWTAPDLLLDDALDAAERGDAPDPLAKIETQIRSASPALADALDAAVQRDGSGRELEQVVTDVRTALQQPDHLDSKLAKDLHEWAESVEQRWLSPQGVTATS